MHVQPEHALRVGLRYPTQLPNRNPVRHHAIEMWLACACRWVTQQTRQRSPVATSRRYGLHHALAHHADSV